MGGKVFPGLTRRYQADEYFALCDEVLDIVSRFADRFDVIPAYGAKESFGDMDILFVPSEEFLEKDLKPMLMMDFVTLNVSHNGGVWSLVYKEFQIDLIRTNAPEYDYSMNYFSYNDRGNLVGRIAHKFGLKHGHDGLTFPVRSDDHVLGSVLLTLDPVQAEKFLDIKSGEVYYSLEEVFANVAASTYFNPEIFLLENRNHTARVRDRKRTTYMNFLEWCKTLPEKKYFQYAPKEAYHQAIFDAFPHAKKEFDALWAKKLLREEAAAKFNGHLVAEWTGADGKELGKLMIELKKTMTPEVVVTMSELDIKAFVKTTMEKLND